MQRKQKKVEEIMAEHELNKAALRGDCNAKKVLRVRGMIKSVKTEKRADGGIHVQSGGSYF